MGGGVGASRIFAAAEPPHPNPLPAGERELRSECRFSLGALSPKSVAEKHDG